jgi:hypothetical protein
MTIATGFVHDEGLLFCVDTKITTAIKTDESKIVYRNYGSGQCATTFVISANDLKFAKTAIECCEDAIAKVDFDDKGITVESVRKTIQSALAKFYKENIFLRSDYGSGVAVDFEFLIGIWLTGEMRLFLTRETMLSAVREYECLGSGAYLTKYLIRQFARAKPGPMTLPDAALIATFAVESAIGYDESCGGEAEILIMKNNGEVGNAYETAVYPGTGFAEILQIETWRLLRKLAHAKRGETDPLLEDYFDHVRKINAAAEFWPPDEYPN